MISDDLAALFAAPAQGLTQEFAIVLGTVISFDSRTGANSISVMGANLPNVPVMRVGSQSALTVGDTVLLGRIGNSYVVVGSISQVARHWRVPETTVRWACRKGHVTAVKIGREWFVSSRSAGKRFGRVEGKVSG